MTTKMSLHRIIAEIKSIEAKMVDIHSAAFVYNATGEVKQEKLAELKAESQSNFDRFSSMFTNLAALKAARNLTNSTTKVKISGVEMTIDEALAQKAVMQHKREFMARIQGQFLAAKGAEDRAAAAIEQKLSQQIASAFTGTKKASEDEIKVLRGVIESSNKVTTITADGLKDRYNKFAEAINAFEVEVDYVLSEANATTVVDVVMV